MSVENEKLVFINTPPKFEIDLALGYWPPKSEAEKKKFSYLLFLLLLLLLSKREKDERIAAQRSGGE